MDKPEDIKQNLGDMKFYRQYEFGAVPICEDCWREIPRYVDFPRGLVSPESSGDAGGNFIKKREVAIGPVKDDGSPQRGIEHLQKVVCLSCYRLAFNRVYPGVPWPNLRGDYTVPQPELVEEPPTIVVGSGDAQTHRSA